MCVHTCGSIVLFSTLPHTYTHTHNLPVFIVIRSLTGTGGIYKQGVGLRVRGGVLGLNNLWAEGLKRKSLSNRIRLFLHGSASMWVFFSLSVGWTFNGNHYTTWCNKV